MITVRPLGSVKVSNGNLIELEAGFCPNVGCTTQMVSNNARRDKAVRLLVTKVPFELLDLFRLG